MGQKFFRENTAWLMSCLMDKIDTRTRRFLHKILSYATMPAGRLHQSLVSKNLFHAEAVGTGIVFIVGAPRTGTTLLYQILTNMINVGYLSNLFYHSLLSGIVLHERIFGSRPHNNFTSDNGRTRRWIDVNESGKFWYQWYPKDVPKLTDEILFGIDFSTMVGTIRNIQLKLKKPLVFKNQTSSQRVRSFARLFPGSIFVHVIRDPLPVARSIIRQRRRFLGSQEKWLSLKPENYEEIKDLDYVEQVVRQIHGVDGMIRSAFDELNTNRCMTVRYEDLDKQWSDITRGVLKKLSRFGRAEKRWDARSLEIIINNTKQDTDTDFEAREIAQRIKQEYG